jgi:hypothetical protein
MKFTFSYCWGVLDLTDLLWVKHKSYVAGYKHHIKGQVKHTSPLAESKLDHIKGQVKHTSPAAECKVYHVKG